MNLGWWVDQRRPWYIERPFPWPYLFLAIAVVIGVVAIAMVL